MRVALEYGDGTVDVTLPSDSVVVSPDMVSEPTALSDPVAATRDAISNPLGTGPLGDLVGRGSVVTIAFPDRVKGGHHDTAHRKVALPLLLDELERAGVRHSDVRLICAIGLHRKNKPAEIRTLLGDAVVDRVGEGRVFNHDAEDAESMVDLGVSSAGDPVQVNRHGVESDLTVLIGHAAGNPYGGYSGGYKMPATGLTSWRSIASHHTPRSLYRDDFVPVSATSHFRHQLRAIGQRMEEVMPRPFFAVDAAIDSGSRQMGVWAGAIPDVERASWQLAAQRADVPMSAKADVLLLGIPRTFHYGPGMGSNPVLMMQAIGASLIRAKEALVDRPIVIAAAVCDGWFNSVDFPSYEETFHRLETCAHPSEMTRHEEEFATDPEWVRRYRADWAYHPFHAFSMVYMGGAAREYSTQVFVAGAVIPGHARAMGARTTATVEAALAESAAILGRQPTVVVIPRLSAAQYHLRPRS